MVVFVIGTKALFQRITAPSPLLWRPHRDKLSPILVGRHICQIYKFNSFARYTHFLMLSLRSSPRQIADYAGFDVNALHLT